MSTTLDTGPARTTTRQRVGLVLAGVFCLLQVPSALFPTPEGEVGPPYAILVACSLLGVAGTVAVVLAWRSGHRVALRVLAASMVLIELTSLPALFVDVPAFVKAGVAVSLVWLLVTLVLVFSGRSQEAS